MPGQFTLNLKLSSTHLKCVGPGALTALGAPMRPLAGKRRMRSAVVQFLFLSNPNSPTLGFFH